MKELTYKDFEDYEQRLKEEAYYCMGDVISPKSREGFESVVRCYMAMKDFEKALHIKQDSGDLKQWVHKMENADGSYCEHWTVDQTSTYMTSRGMDSTKEEFYAAMNMMFSDYYPVAKKHNVNTPEFYADLAAAFINDKDASKDKVEKYYECVVE